MLDTNEVRIETCTFCNYRCVFCPHSNMFTRQQQIMSLEDFKWLVLKIEKQIPQIKEYTISGFGEAFLDPTIMSKIEFVKDRQHDVHILTNGSLLSHEQIKNLFELEVSDIRISLHTINSKNYRLITGATNSAFMKVLDNIDYILEEKKNNRRYTTRVVLTCDIIDNINGDDIPEIIEKYSKCVDLLEIWKPHNWVNDMKFREGELVKKTCGRPFNGPVQIQVDGTINMCCFDYNGKLLLGDTNTQSFREIFSSEEYRKLKECHEKGTLNESNYICNGCDQRMDSSGCMIYNNKFKEEDRLGRTSTNYRKVNNG